jgi:hypothetical protein
MGDDSAPPTTEPTEDVSTNPRRRPRDGFFWQLIILRIPMAVFAIAIIAYLARYINKWQGVTRPSPDGHPASDTPKDAVGQSGLALGMVRKNL